jgi:Tol biopolymer transport system component
MGNESLFYRAPKGGAFPADWSRDGERLLVHLDDSNGRPTGLAAISKDGASVTPIVADGSARINFGRFSPDGTHVSFNADPTGAFEVYVLSLADGRRTRVSTGGGLGALWGRNGRELFFITPEGDVMVSAISAGASLTASVPARLFRPCQPGSTSGVFPVVFTERTLDITADGSRFLARCDSIDLVPSSAMVAVNWQSRVR